MRFLIANDFNIILFNNYQDFFILFLYMSTKLSICLTCILNLPLVTPNRGAVILSFYLFRDRFPQSMKDIFDFQIIEDRRL